MEEPGVAEIDAAEELPVARQLGLQDVEVRLAGIAAQQLVQLLGAEDEQHHQAIVGRARLAQAGLLADTRSTAVTADGIGRVNDPAAATASLFERDRRAGVVLADLPRVPAVHQL